MKTIIITYIIFIVLSLDNRPLFSQPSKSKNIGDKFFEIKYEELLKQKNNINLSQIASKVEYIQLETNENCLLNHNARYYFSDNFIFVSNWDHILKFSSDGKFLKKIGNPGRGPGEINSIRVLSIIPEKKLIIIHDPVPRKLRYYSFDGNLIKTVNIPQDLVYLKVMKDGNYIAIAQSVSVSEKYTHTLINESGDTLSAVKNYTPWKNPSPIVTTILSPSFIPFYTYQNKYFLKSLYNDTVYVVKANKITPGYYINLGKYKLPPEKRFERLNPEEAKIFQKEEAPKYCFAYVLEAGGRFFLTSNNFGNHKIEHFVINKNGFIEKSNDRYLSVFRNYIFNDWDGGVYFWPDGNIDDNKVFMPIDIKYLKDVLKVRSSAKTPFKFPEQQKQLEKLASNLDITENPILMIVTLKTDK
jgi:hypothetical protein